MNKDHQKRIEEARLKYKPDTITCLFIAEAPPSDPNRFFYFEDVAEQDSLYLEMMKVLIPLPKTGTLADYMPLDAPELRKHKPKFLQTFKDLGYYLIDNLDYPLPYSISGTNEKIKFLQGQKQQLYTKVQSLVDTKTPIVLISVPVFQANYGNLKYYGFNIIHSEPIEFPGSGQQANFREKMEKLLSKIQQPLP